MTQSNTASMTNAPSLTHAGIVPESRTHADHTTSAARPRVQVLLASRNGAASIERQIGSVLAQEAVDVLLDVRDDGSTDQTRDVVRAISAGDSRVRLLADHVSTGSASGNFFALIREASLDGIDFVAFCDQDDEWFPRKLARAIEQMRSSGSTGYSAASMARWGDGRQRLLAQNSHMRRGDHLFEGAGQGCTFVFEAELLRRLRTKLSLHSALLKDVHYHDWSLFALTRASGARWHFDAEPTMYYEQHGANDTGARNSSDGIARRLALIRQGWYRGQVNAVVRLVLASFPDHAPALEWAALSGASGSRLQRAWFVARHGRRRTLDRLIQVIAATLGYL